MTRSHRHLARLVVAALAAAAGLVGITSSPSSAAQCSATTGVSVVVDFNRGAGGGVQSACAAGGGGKYASEIFPSAGFPLEYVTSGSGGFVCRVKSAPQSANCGQTAPEDAYWALFWAKKGSRTWTYSTAGVSTLRVPEGGSVAWAFQDGGDTNRPAMNPAPRATPKPTKPPKSTPKPAPTKGAGGTKPGTKPGTQPGTQPGKTSTPTPLAVVPQTTAATSATPSPSASPTPSASASTSASAAASLSASPSGSPSDATSASPASAAETDGSFKPAAEQSGLPVWVPVAVILVLALAAWAGLWWRNRSGEA